MADTQEREAWKHHRHQGPVVGKKILDLIITSLITLATIVFSILKITH